MHAHSRVPIKRCFLVLMMVVSYASTPTASADVLGFESKGIVADDPSLETASRAVRQGRDADALTLIRQASLTHPNWPPAMLELARLQFAAGQPEKARRTLERTAVECPDEPRVYLIFGSLALTERRYTDARINGEKVLGLLDHARLDADTARAIRRETFSILATAAETLGDWGSARLHLTNWLELDPKDASARQRLGRALFFLGRLDEAQVALAQSVRDDPKLGPAAMAMAMLFVQTSNTIKAEEWFLKAAREEPKSATVRLAHARWMLDQGRNAEARALVEEARKLDPNSREIEPLRGLVAMQMRDYTLAEAIFSRLSKADPSQPAYAALFTLALVEQDDPSRQTQGLNLAEANARRFPKALDILAALGRAHARVGHRDEAERCLRAAIAAAGGQATPTTAYFLAEVLVRRGATEDARILLTGATASPIAFAYLADARKQLASLQTAPGAGSSNSDVGISKP